MEFLTWGTNPWGQEILIRISWDLLYLSAVAGVVFVVVHAIWYQWWVPKPAASPEAATDERAAGVPERVPRHSMASRLFHWVMAVAIFVLLFTGFLPIVGIQFAWVTFHWIAGVVLILSVVYHIIHASFWMDLWAVWIGPRDVREAWQRMRDSLARSGSPPPKHGKYPLENKFYHHIIVLTTFAVMGTGLVMMVRVDTPFWTRDPYLFTEQTWGLIYVLHDLASVALVALVLAHVYFAVRPEKLWITWSMIVGWIDRRHYLEHHDPERWVVKREPPKDTQVA